MGPFLIWSPALRVALEASSHPAQAHASRYLVFKEILFRIGKRGGKGKTGLPKTNSAQQVFESGAEAGLVVAILYDHRCVEAEAPLLAPFMALAFADGAGA